MNVRIRALGLQPYEACWQRMRAFVDARTPATEDEIWLLEHPPVFTLGLAGDPAHVLCAGNIPVIHTDRGGQVTYHGPGQLVGYVLLDMKRLGVGPRELVRRLEEAAIRVLEGYGVAGERRRGAPGVYVGGAKIAALGLRVRRGASYHGLALNVSADLAPFARINPCGYEGLQVTSLAALGVASGLDAVAERLAKALVAVLYPDCAVRAIGPRLADNGLTPALDTAP